MADAEGGLLPPPARVRVGEIALLGLGPLASIPHLLFIPYWMLNPQNRQGWSRLLGFFYALYTVPPVLLQALVLTPMVCLWALGRSQAPAGLKRRLVLLSLVVCAVNLGLSLAVLEVI